MFRLVVQAGPNPGKVYELTQDVINLGRDISNEIIISDTEVSRFHSRLTAQKDERGMITGYAVEDRGSTNGTFVSGLRVAGRRMLNAGEVVNMGDKVTLLYESFANAVAHAETVIEQRPLAMPQSPYVAPEMPATPSYSAPIAQPEPAYVAPAPVVPAPPMPEASYVAPYEPASESYAPQTPPAPAKPNHTVRNIVVGCGCLTAFACVLFVGVMTWAYMNGTLCSLLPMVCTP
ncbi:MAG TPA: FHA domain-containing protein [Anaerolineales bacterium]|nr:FHA domain-containing protein [Anaerolineales bacterium]